MISTTLSLVAMIIAGTVLSVTGAYIYHKKQSSEDSDKTPTGKMSMLVAVYVMSLGGVLLIVGLYLLHGLLTGHIHLAE